jgi:hypothetical protein
MKHSITVVLNAYKRLDLLNRQIDSIMQQTILPSEILIWNNSGKELGKFFNEDVPVFTFNSEKNLGVWARFAVALNSKSNYIAVFDDDTIPGKKWFENCLNNIGDGNRLLGTRGLRFFSNKNYSPFESYGWDNPNENLVEVDIIGHAWFFERRLLSEFWGKYEDRYEDDYCGEDIHLSFSIQKIGCKSFVPPHCLDDMESWGSLPEFALCYGTDASAISSSSMALNKFTKAYSHYISKNFETYYMNHKSSAKVVIKTSFREKGISKFIAKSPGLYKLMKTIKKKLNEKGIQF